MRNPLSISWRVAAQYVLGGALLVLVCFRLIFGDAPMGLADRLVGLAALGLVCLIATRSIESSTRSVALGRVMAGRGDNAHRPTTGVGPAMVWTARADGSRDFDSPRWLELTGLSADESRGDGWLAAIHPEDRAFVAESWACATANGAPFEAKARVRSAGGSCRWLLIHAEPLRDETGRIIKWHGSNTGIEEQMCAPDAVRTSEAEWREVFEHNPVMYFMVDSSEIVLSVNTFGAAQLGYSVDELLGRSVLTVFREDDRATVRRNVADCLDNIGQTRSWEIRKIRKDGSQIWVRENAKAVRRANDQEIVLIACEDITERVVAENALRRSEMYLAEAQRLSHTGSFGWHVDTGEIVWSEETFSIFGYDNKSVVTLDMIMERVHLDDRPRVARTIERASLDGRDFQHSYRLCLPGGRTKHVHAVAHAARSASCEMTFIGAVTDITARKLIEAELRQSEQRFRDYAETASDWFWETDPDQRLTNVSHNGGTVTGRIGGLAWEFAADLEEEPEKWRRHFDDLAARRPFRNFRYRATAPDGTLSYVETSGKPVFDPDGRYLGYRGVASDVTAAARAEHAEQALREAQANLERVTRVTALGELTASIAHEVNQPLAAVVANAAAGLRWLARDMPDLPEARRSLQLIMDDANRAGEVIRRVRGLVNKGAVEKVPLDLNDVVREVTGLVQQQLSNRRVTLRLDLDSALPPVRADRVQLQQLLLNLVINAIEAMEQVTDRSLELSIRTMRDDAGQLVLTVRDCGVGIDAAVADSLFDPFFTTKRSGMGIGLSICRSIAEAHGGRLTASPNDGPGATFRFTLPPCREGIEA